MRWIAALTLESEAFDDGGPCYRTTHKWLGDLGFRPPSRPRSQLLHLGPRTVGCEVAPVIGSTAAIPSASTEMSRAD